MTDTFTEGSFEAEQPDIVFQKMMMEMAHEALQTLAEECQYFMGLHLNEGLESNEIIKISELPRTTFYRQWNACYSDLVTYIQQKLHKRWDKK